MDTEVNAAGCDRRGRAAPELAAASPGSCAEKEQAQQFTRFGEAREGVRPVARDSVD